MLRISISLAFTGAAAPKSLSNTIKKSKTYQIVCVSNSQYISIAESFKRWIIHLKMLKSVSKIFLKSHLCPLKTMFVYFESWFNLEVCDVIWGISLVFTMCSVRLQQDCVENKISLNILQRYITKIQSENVPTKVSVLNSWRARRQEMLNSLLIQQILSMCR